MIHLLSSWFQVEGFGNDPARGSEAGAALVKWGLVGRIGVGRGWQDDEETFYHLKDAVSRTNDVFSSLMIHDLVNTLAIVGFRYIAVCY